MSHTIPYHLRHHKAIERNLFLDILKKLSGYRDIEIDKFRYIGFGAPFLEDFKMMHLEFGINDMHCIEINKFAHSRQRFNNPFQFVELFHTSSTDYITGSSFKEDKSQIIWLDFVYPGEIRQQLQDIELLAQRTKERDILKFTFNAAPKSFQNSHGIKDSVVNHKKLLEFISNDATYQHYFPDHIKVSHIIKDFSILLRAMAIRAVKRGLRSAGSNLDFNHISSFSYADGQAMTTITGILCEQEEFDRICKECGFVNWDFYQPNSKDDVIESFEIKVPSMTVLERIAIDRLIPAESIDTLISSLEFNYGENPVEHKKLLEGYHKYYRFLPYYSRVTY